MQKRQKQGTGWISIIAILAVILIVVIFVIPKPQPEENTNCANRGERISNLTDELYNSCCTRLTAWDAGTNTKISIGNQCYESGVQGGKEFGICIDCGNTICEENENACSCPEDCTNGENSQYATAEAFCEDWKLNCQHELSKNLPMCQLCQ